MLRFTFLMLFLIPLRGHADEAWVCPETSKQFCTGAMSTPDTDIAEAPLFVVPGSPPRHVAYIPKVRSMFGNDRYGVCVTSEEAFAKSCWIAGSQPEIDVPENIVVDWARKRGLLHGASLGPVCDMMFKEGFRNGSQLYNNGQKRLVDYRDEAALQAAIATGPVKVAIKASTLGAGAGTRDGWYSLGGQARGSDHCVSICGYGTADWLYGELGVSLPEKIPPDTPGYLCYTWSTIGFVDSAWIKGNIKEAWVRTPTTIGIPPIAPPFTDWDLLRPLRRLGVLLLVFLLGGCFAGLLIVFARRLLPKGPWFGP